MSLIFDLVRAVPAVEPGSPAVEDGGRWYLWEDLSARRELLDALLTHLGLGVDSRIGVVLDNRFEPYAALLAVAATDRCLVAINPSYPDAAVAENIHDVAAPVIVAEEHQWERTGFRDAVSASGAAGIILGGNDVSPIRLVKGLENFDRERARTTAPGVAVEMLTSGTTGKPKRVDLQREAIVSGFDSSSIYEKGRRGVATPRLREGVQILQAPLSHVGGVWYALNSTAAGRKVCLIERFSVEAWHRAIVNHRPKLASAPPAALRMILDANIPKADLSSLVAVMSGSAPLSDSLVRECLDRYDLPVLGMYGATEFFGSVAGWTLSLFREFYPQKAGSVGRLLPGIEARTVDEETGEVLPSGQEGTLELKGKQLIDDSDWVRTSDRAIVDEDSFVFILGRADAAINRGGFKINPDDVVNALHEHPAVREAAVFAIADDRLGEVPAAAIVFRDHTPHPDRGELVSFLKERLAPYQIPTEWKFLPDLPRTSSMKPSIVALKTLFSAANGHDPA